MGDQPRFRLTLIALPSTVPHAVRLRRALKCLLRSFGLKVERFEELAEQVEIPSGGTVETQP